MNSWLQVFDDEFDGAFNGQPILDTRNVEGAATTDGLDDRVWTPLYGSTAADALAVTPQAPGGDPGGSEGGYLRMRNFTETLPGGGKRLHSARTLATGETGEHPNNLTRGFFEATYGYAEARVKLVQPRGAVSAWWMYSRDLHWNYSKPLRDPANAGIEIDIFEEWDVPDRVSSTLHWDGYADTHQSETTDNTVICPGSPCEGNFHTYGVRWDPTGYRFFIDGQETSFMPRGASHHPQFFMLSTNPAAGHDFGPLGDPRNAEMLVDYVKVWQPAVSDIDDQTTQRNVPRSIPFTTSSIVTEQAPDLPGPRAASVVVGSSNQSVVRNSDLVVTGSGADRTLVVMPRSPDGVAGTATILVLATDAGGSVLGHDAFNLTVTDPAVPLPTLAPGALPDLDMAASVPGSVAFTTPVSDGTNPGVTAQSSNPYLLPDSGLGFAGSGRTRALSMAPLPTRTGTADVTVTVTDPADGSATSDTFRVTVTHARPANPGFEQGQTSWTMIGGNGAPSAGAARTGTQGFHMEIGAIKQKITVEPNSTYAIGGWGRVAAPGGSFAIGVIDTDSSVAGEQAVTTLFDSTSWSRKDVVFTSGKFTREVEIIAGNFGVSNVAFDLDDVYLVDGPEVSRIPDQSIGHSTCVAPRFWIGRVGAETGPWTVTAAVSGGDASLVSNVTVVSNVPANRYERALRITPTTDQTKSGKVTIRITVADVEGRRRTDDVDVWVNAGDFRNGSFEHDAFGESTYPGCDPIPAAWSRSDSQNISVSHIDPYAWATGYRNPGLLVKQARVTTQSVTGLQANTEYVAMGWVELRTWPDAGVTLPDGAAIRVHGDVTPISPANGIAARRTTGWQQLSVRFRTGSAGTASISLSAPNHATYFGQFHDITLTKAP